MRRIVLVGCDKTHQTPWARATGEESYVRILHLIEGELVRIEHDAGVNEFAQPGVFPLKLSGRYRVSKHVSDSVHQPAPTLVEFMLG